MKPLISSWLTSSTQLDPTRARLRRIIRSSGLLGAAVAVVAAVVFAAGFDSGSARGTAPFARLGSSTGLVSRTADFGAETASSDVRQIANWVLDSGDNGQLFFVIIDKKNTRIFVFGPDGSLKGAAPILIGSAKGDDSVAGIGTRPLSGVLPHERTTPAGRFIAEPGHNADGEDIVWVDYDAAVSMHRVRALVPKERRLQRLASADPQEHRISYGCINLPVAFFDVVLKPAFNGQHGMVYVLPEVKTLEAVFKSAHDVAAKKGAVPII